MASKLLARIALGLALAASSTSIRAEETETAAGTRRALIICGLTGDATHRALFSQTIETIYAGLTTHHGFSPENVAVLWSERKENNDGPALSASTGPATREVLSESAAKIVESLKPRDALWVFVLGHAHFDGKNSWLNLPGPDMNQVELAALFSAAACQEQVFFMTTAASGFFIKPLSKPGRIIVSATEADREVNETIFPHKLAAALDQPPPYLEFDMDSDGRVSLLDVYLWAAQATAQEYVTEMLLATEHANLDDNGDGRGTELQRSFLTEELGGRRAPDRPPPLIVSGDGALAQQIMLYYPPSPPLPEPDKHQ
jgi:hypothetical protein